ncbi:MAG: hypothetical protein NTU53_17750 [Planctomycetota bacterium]|nr:hypothetical protein [Planctomycetota bacterium]
MRWCWLVVAVLLMGIGGSGFRVQGADAGEEKTVPVPVSDRVRFGVVDVFVDSGGDGLAVWQVEMKAVAGDVKIVGIESGGHAAYKEPPFYDPAAMMGGRVILGAYSLEDEALPTGKTRVARVHVRVGGDAKPEYEVKLVVAAAKAGKPIAAKVMVAEGEGQ